MSSTPGSPTFSAAYSRKYFEVQKYVTATPMFSLFFLGYVNPAWWNGLTDGQRAAIEKASAEAADLAPDAILEAAAKAPDQLREKGMIVHIHIPGEIAAMKAVMDPAFSGAFAGATGESGRKLLEMINAM